MGSVPYLCGTIKNPSCGSGVIGSRTRLRIWRRKAWGFESLLPHLISSRPKYIGRIFIYNAKITRRKV